MKYIPYNRQSINDLDILEVIKVLKSDFITQGDKINEFESALSEYCSAQYAVVFNSGTSALHAAYFACGLSYQDEFITSPITFAATSNAGLYLGATPVFADTEYDTANIDTSKIEVLITNKTKLIVPVHYAGHPVDLEKIYYIAKKYKLFVVEDACHALGATYKEAIIGSCKYSDMTVFSFHPVKTITTGEGGAVLTNNEKFYKNLLLFRSHGITKESSRFIIHNPQSDGDWYYEMQLLGYNYRMTDFQAALGISQLKRLDEFINKRKDVYNAYNQVFKDIAFFDLPVNRQYANLSYHLYPIRLKYPYIVHKPKIFKALRDSGIGVQVHYIPVYFHPYYQNLGYRKGICPVAEEFYYSALSLPIYADLSQEDFDYVVNTVFKVFNTIFLNND